MGIKIYGPRLPAHELAEEILGHPAVCRALSSAEIYRQSGVGIHRLVRLRKARADAQRCHRNMREEFAAASRCERRGGPGAAYGAGYAVQAPRPHVPRAIAEALEAGGLPADLEQMCRDFLAAQEGEK